MSTATFGLVPICAKPKCGPPVVALQQPLYVASILVLRFWRSQVAPMKEEICCDLEL